MHLIAELIVHLGWLIEDLLVYGGFVVVVGVYCGALSLWALGDDWALLSFYEVLWSPHLDPLHQPPTQQ